MPDQLPGGPGQALACGTARRPHSRETALAGHLGHAVWKVLCVGSSCRSLAPLRDGPERLLPVSSPRGGRPAGPFPPGSSTRGTSGPPRVRVGVRGTQGQAPAETRRGQVPTVGPSLVFPSAPSPDGGGAPWGALAPPRPTLRRSPRTPGPQAAPRTGFFQRRSARPPRGSPGKRKRGRGHGAKSQLRQRRARARACQGSPTGTSAPGRPAEKCVMRCQRCIRRSQR